MPSDYELMLRISDHGFISGGAISLTSDLSMSLGSASQTNILRAFALRLRYEPVFCILTMTHEHMLHISDHCLLRQQNLRSWACVRRTTSANIPETHLPRTIKSRSFQPLLHCWRVQFYREKSSRGYPLTMSGSSFFGHFNRF